MESNFKNYIYPFRTDDWKIKLEILKELLIPQNSIE